MMRARRLWRAVVAAIVLAGSAAPTLAAGAAPPTIAAAADLNAVMPELTALFRRATGDAVTVVYGSSGAFTQQILQGAPFQVFLSADEAYVDKLAAAGRTDGAGALYAIGRIGVFAPTGSVLHADSGLSDLKAAARDGRLQHFAIANPEHAPYGRAAQEALTHAGLWESVRPKLVLGDNIAQATQFATSGSAQGGIIPLSLALTPAIHAKGAFALIPADWHKPLRQRAVLIRGATPVARAFYAFLQSAPARAVLVRYGFTLPDPPH